MSKKSKLDLLVRVRYLNPLPPPPFPPKLLSIPTDINRLGEPSYLDHLAASTPLPMLVDSEMGMPLDLNRYDGVWDGNDTALNPVLDPERKFDPADAALLVPLQLRAAPANGMPERAQTASEVSWMRNSNLFTRRAAARKREAADTSDKVEQVVDASEYAQLMTIEKSFQDVHEQNLEDIRHPDKKKKQLRVIETYDVLPDDATWSNQYHLLRFPERPSAATALNPSASASSPRLAKAVLRPLVQDEDIQVMEYYLPKEDDLERAEESYGKPIGEDGMARLRELVEEDGSDPRIDGVMPNVEYERIRTYEVVSRALPSKEVLLSFYEADEAEGKKEDDGADGDQRSRKRRKGAYFKELSSRVTLRKTRVRRRDEEEARDDQWDRTRIGYRVPYDEEVESREAGKSKVTEPTWVNDDLRRLKGGDDVAVGQGEAIDDEEAPDDEEARRIEEEVEGEDEDE